MIEDPGRLQLALLFLLLFFSAFFSSAEAAFLSLQRLRLRHLVEKGNPTAKRVQKMIERPEHFLSTVLFGNNLVNTAAAALATTVAISVLKSEEKGIIAATIVVTIALLIFGETVPKSIAARHAERVAFFYVRPMEWLGWLLFPFVIVLRTISGRIVRIFGSSERIAITEEEIKTIISVGREAGVVEHREAEWLRKVFQFTDRRVKEVMTPRTELVWMEKGTTLKDFLDSYREHTHTRFPVYEGDVDNVISVLSVKDVLKAMAQKEVSLDEDVTRFTRPVHFAPESKLVGELFSDLRRSGQQMAIVIDEYGGVAGLVTLKQLVEEVVGRVGEEGTSQEEYVALDENNFILDGGMRVDEANEKLKLDIPEGDYETVSGFILESLGRIPREGDHVYHGAFTLSVAEMDGVKIEKVRVTRISSPSLGVKGG